MLYVVPTPIGNLQDITLRALDVLKSVDLILAEDTRNTKHLLDRYAISTPMSSYHAHNEHRRLSSIIRQLQHQHIALVSDGGTPGISDPGFLLIRACIEAQLPVQVLPGASALTTALVSSGLPCNRFYFEGFLPHKKGRKTRLNYLARLDQTTIIYESPHRLLKCLHQLAEHCGTDRSVSVCKELSKKFESVYRGTLAQAIEHFEAIANIKGEYVIVLAGIKD